MCSMPSSTYTHEIAFAAGGNYTATANHVHAYAAAPKVRQDLCGIPMSLAELLLLQFSTSTNDKRQVELPAGLIRKGLRSYNSTIQDISTITIRISSANCAHICKSHMHDTLDTSDCLNCRNGTVAAAVQNVSLHILQLAGFSEEPLKASVHLSWYVVVGLGRGCVCHPNSLKKLHLTSRPPSP